MWTVGGTGHSFSTFASGTLAAPADLWLDMQGQTVAQSTSSPPTPTNANTQTVAWLEVSGATGYNLYRSTNGGAESLYVSNVAPSGTGVVRYIDTVATGCVNGTTGPVTGVYYGANTYRYRVSTLNASGEGAKTVTGQKYYVYNFAKGGTNLSTVNGGGQAAGGFKWQGDFTGGSSTNDYANTGANETGEAWLNTPSGASAYILPVCGGIYTQWNMWMGSASYLYMDIYKTNITSMLAMHAEIVGDLVITPTGPHTVGNGNLDIQSYITNGPATANAWYTYKIPIVDFYTYGGVLQHQVYKFLVQLDSGSVAAYRFDNVYYGE